MSDLYTDRIEDIDHAISAVIAKHTSGIRKKSKCKKLAVWEMMNNKKCWTSSGKRLSRWVSFLNFALLGDIRFSTRKTGKKQYCAQKWPNKRCKRQILGPFPPRVLHNSALYTGPNVPLVIIQQQLMTPLTAWVLCAASQKKRKKTASLARMHSSVMCKFRCVASMLYWGGGKLCIQSRW